MDLSKLNIKDLKSLMKSLRLAQYSLEPFLDHLIDMYSEEDRDVQELFLCISYMSGISYKMENFIQEKLVNKKIDKKNKEK